MFSFLVYSFSSIHSNFRKRYRLSWSYGCDFYKSSGIDFKNISPIRVEYCGGASSTTPGCTHFSWTNWNGGTSWLKKELTLTSSFPYASGLKFPTDNSMMCGYKVS